MIPTNRKAAMNVKLNMNSWANYSSRAAEQVQKKDHLGLQWFSWENYYMQWQIEKNDVQ